MIKFQVSLGAHLHAKRLPRWILTDQPSSVVLALGEILKSGIQNKRYDIQNKSYDIQSKLEWNSHILDSLNVPPKDLLSEK